MSDAGTDSALFGSGPTRCTGCGKDPYLSCTGCLCTMRPGMERGRDYEWVPGHGTYGKPRPLAKDDDGGPISCPECGDERQRAAMQPSVALACGCGAPAGPAADCRPLRLKKAEA